MKKVLLPRDQSWLLYFNYAVTVFVLCLFFAVPWIRLQFVIVAFPGCTNYRPTKSFEA